MSVMEVVMTSSPGSGSIAAIAACMALVPEDAATECVEPIRSAKRCSSAATIVPFVLVSTPLSMTARTAAISSSPSVRPDAS